MRKEYQNFVFLDQFLMLENMVKKIFRNSNFSDFFGIKSEINQCDAHERVSSLAISGSSNSFENSEELKINHLKHLLYGPWYNDFEFWMGQFSLFLEI